MSEDFLQNRPAVQSCRGRERREYFRAWQQIHPPTPALTGRKNEEGVISGEQSKKRNKTVILPPG